jgi:pyruvate,orthophosphate dikinase
VPHATQDRFVWDVEDLDPSDLARFGGKGSGLARMVKAGIPVPPGFVIGTDAFRAYHACGATLPAQLETELENAMARLEVRTGKRFGGDAQRESEAHAREVDSDFGPGRADIHRDEADLLRGEADAGQGESNVGRAEAGAHHAGATAVEPLLVSVRSGAPVSMPGMMDTVLNLGLDATRAFAFARYMRSVPFAIDTWLRFWRMFAEIVLAHDPSELEAAVDDAKAAALAHPSPTTFEKLERAVINSLAEAGVTAPTSPEEQLRLAVCAVFRSWDSRRAKTYRANLGIAETLGTAVTIQAMVFGNRDSDSGSGVAFSCNPNSGERGLFGEYIAGRQGEDLVSGTATPIDLSRPGAMSDALRDALAAHGRDLETLYRDAVDIEFTVESNRLYLLQVRPAKRTAEAAVRIALDLLRAGTISREDAVRRVTPEQLGKLLRPTFDANALNGAQTLARGIGSSPGHAAGIAVLEADDAAERAAKGEHVILLRPTTSPQDIRGMLVAEAIVTARGGALSHAAVVSRALDKPCIVGCESIEVDVAKRSFAVAGKTYAEGTWLSVDGDSGCIYLDRIPLRQAPTGRAQLVELVRAASEISAAEISVSALDVGDVARANVAPGGTVIVGLTDLLISAGAIERLTTAIGALGDDPRTALAEREIEALARDVATSAINASGETPVAFRLPSFLSERARQIVPTWATLPARSLLPLGERSFYAPIARGVTAAAAATGNPGVSLLLSGLTEFGELDAFARATSRAGTPAIGAFVRSFAGLHNFAHSGGDGFDVWVDVDAVVRTAYGFPSELMAARGVFAEYRERGYFQGDPQTTLAPFLLASFSALLERLGVRRACVYCSSGAQGEFARLLFDIGYRRFCVPSNEREQLALRLARAAIGVEA